jgi:hypothetical protein
MRLRKVHLTTQIYGIMRDISLYEYSPTVWLRLSPVRNAKLKKIYQLKTIQTSDLGGLSWHFSGSTWL